MELYAGRILEQNNTYLFLIIYNILSIFVEAKLRALPVLGNSVDFVEF